MADLTYTTEEVDQIEADWTSKPPPGFSGLSKMREDVLRMVATYRAKDARVAELDARLRGLAKAVRSRDAAEIAHMAEECECESGHDAGCDRQKAFWVYNDTSKALAALVAEALGEG